MPGPFIDNIVNKVVVVLHDATGVCNQQKGVRISLLLLQDDVTALMVAVYHGHSHIVEVFTRFKPDVNLQTKVGLVTYCSCM